MQPTPSFRTPLDGLPGHGETPYAEAATDGDALVVDVWAPDHALEDLDVHVQPMAIHLVSRSMPAAFHVAVVLPLPVVAGVHATRSSGGVLEIRMMLNPSP